MLANCECSNPREKFLNNILAEETLRKIFPFLLAILLFIIAGLLYKRSKRNEEYTDDGNDSSDNSNKYNVTYYNVSNKDGELEIVKGEEHVKVKDEVYENHGVSSSESRKL